MNNNTVAIKTTRLHKAFKLPKERSSFLKNALINAIRGIRGYETQKVLNDISFEVRKGEFFGIVGRNGSGKSTLLKLLAGIYTPNSGDVQINGKLTPFIELGVGFNPELSGRENVYLNGALMGFDRKEVEAMYDDVVEFAELERFMNQKLKNYSSGMQVRLAFSIAIQSKSEILLFDEVLAVGDANFQKKCFDVFRTIKKEGRTVILVTHDMGAVQQYCTRALLLEKGRIHTIGDTNRVTKNYNNLNLEHLEAQSGHSDSRSAGNNQKAFIKKIWTEKKSKPSKAFSPKDDIRVHIEVEATQDIESPTIGITIKDQVNRPLFATNTHALKVHTGNVKKGQTISCDIDIQNAFSDGNYYVIPSVSSKDTSELFDSIEDGYMFTTVGWDFPAFVMQPKHTARVTKT